MSKRLPFEALMSALGYRFQSQELLVEAMTHSSYRNEHRDVEQDNERLEFLGDSILGAVIGHRLVEMYPDVSEGELTRFKAVLVSEQGLLETAKKLDLGRYLLLGRGEDRSGGRRKSSVLANAMEALIAAIYLDGGFDPAFRVVADLYKLGLVEVGQAERRVDFKTKLQEVVQERHQELPVYRVAGFSGPDHDRVYETILLVQGRELARGMGRSKKESEQVAARQAYETMTSVSESADDSD